MIESKNDFLKSYRDYCETALLSFKGGPDFIDRFLLQHARETPLHYTKRREFSFYLNYVEKIVNVLSGFIIRGVSRSFGKIPVEVSNLYTEAIDFYSPLDSFIQDKIADHLLTGNAFALVDSIIGSGARAFVHSVNYTNIVDFSLENGAISSITVSVAPGKVLEITPALYRYLNDEGERTGPDKKNALGLVPFVAINKKIDAPAAFFRDAISTNKAIFNHFNNINQQLFDSGFGILAVPGVGSDKPIDPTTLSFVEFNPMFPDMLPRYIMPDLSHLEFYASYIDRIIDKMLSSLNIYRSEDKATSGLSKSYDYSMMSSTLSKLSLTMQKFEVNMWSMLSKFDSRLKPEEIAIQYPREFDISTLKEDLDNVLTLMSLQISNTFDKALKKRIVSKQIDDAVLKKEIEAEIEADTGPAPDLIVPGQNDNPNP